MDKGIPANVILFIFQQSFVKSWDELQCINNDDSPLSLGGCEWSGGGAFVYVGHNNSIKTLIF